jgi:hypothetical protein
MTTMAPSIDNIRKHTGIAGQYSYTVTVTYPGEPPHVVEFLGSIYGGPIVAILSEGLQVFVSRDVTDRIGAILTAQWVRDYFAPRED